MSLQATQDESTRRRRPNHAGRAAESHAAFLLPHLRPGMALLDLGCGPGSTLSAWRPRSHRGRPPVSVSDR